MHIRRIFLRRDVRVKLWQRQRLLNAVLLLALFLRSLVPDGFMPAKGELVELCTMHGPRMVLADPATGELLQAEDGDDASTAACPWSLLLTSLAASSFPSPAGALDKAPAAAAEIALPPISRPSLIIPPARAPPTPILS